MREYGEPGGVARHSFCDAAGPHTGNGPRYEIALLDQSSFRVIDVLDLAFAPCQYCGGDPLRANACCRPTVPPPQQARSCHPKRSVALSSGWWSFLRKSQGTIQ